MKTGEHLDTSASNQHWDVIWRDHQGQVQTLVFELGRALCYRVIMRGEQDKERFLRDFLRPPESALLVSDGGLLGNIKVDENLLLPLSYRGVDTGLLESRVVELFAQCGLDEAQTRLLLGSLPHQLSPYQKRVVGFVRSVLLQPKVMVYASIWHGVTQAERRRIIGFDAILRRYVPLCTTVFVDYDAQTDTPLHAHQTFFL